MNNYFRDTEENIRTLGVRMFLSVRIYNYV